MIPQKRTRRSKATGTETDRERTRARLIESAGEIFAELGFHHATVRQICNRARANIAAVNYHFGDKSGLYLEVVRQSLRAARLDAVRAALEQNTSPEEALRQVVKVRLESLGSQELGDWHFRIIAHELAKPTPAMNQVLNEAIRPVYVRLREVISKILGLPPEHDKTRLCANSIVGQILFYAFARPILTRLWPGMVMTETQVNLIATHIADFSLAYLRTASVKHEHPPDKSRRRK
jgi:AcrR family transcriptional regulator